MGNSSVFRHDRAFPGIFFDRTQAATFYRAYIYLSGWALCKRAWRACYRRGARPAEHETKRRRAAVLCPRGCRLAASQAHAMNGNTPELQGALLVSCERAQLLAAACKVAAWQTVPGAGFQTPRALRAGWLSFCKAFSLCSRRPV